MSLVLDSFGSYLGIDKGCIIVRDRDGKTERHPLFEEEMVKLFLRLEIWLALEL